MGLKTNLTDYIEAGEPTLDERLAGLSASATGHGGAGEEHSDRAVGGAGGAAPSGVPPSAAEDKIDWKAHVARYHGGSFDPKVEHCEVYERMMKEAEGDIYSPDDADGDGIKDEYHASAEGDVEDGEEGGSPDDGDGGNGETDSETADYFKSVSKSAAPHPSSME